MVAAYRGFDPRRQPVLLVHGFGDSPQSMVQLAERLHVAGRQVLVYVYDDRGATVRDSGAALAAELRRIGAEHYPGGELRVVGHSMGGLVTRAAVARLEDDREGFARFNVRSIDSPWMGYADQAPNWIARLARGVMNLFGLRSLGDLLAGSDLFAEHERRLDPRRYQAQHIMAAHAANFDVRSVPELTAAERTALARFFDDGALPPGRWERAARYTALALREDTRYEALVAGYRTRRKSDPSESPADTVSAVFERVMPRFAGGHTEALVPADGRSALLDQLVADLT